MYNIKLTDCIDLKFPDLHTQNRIYTKQVTNTYERITDEYDCNISNYKSVATPRPSVRARLFQYTFQVYYISYFDLIRSTIRYYVDAQQNTIVLFIQLVQQI